MRNFFVVLSLLMCPLGPAVAQVSVQIGLPGVNIGINQPVYPRMVAVPGYPVYYAPSGDSNYFFYDGMYWVYQGDSWYSSSWYNGPWAQVGPQAVPLFILRVPVRYYRHPPAYFRGWGQDAPPRWGEHWGSDWERQRSGWNQWNRAGSPAPAPLPSYQKMYSGNRYPHPEMQQALKQQHDGQKPRDAEVKQVYQRQPVQAAPQAARHEQAAKSAKPENRGEQPGRNRQQEQVQPASRQPQQVRAPEPDKGSKGKSGAPEPKGNGSQAKHEDHGSERNN